MRTQYDFSKGRWNRYAARYARRSNVVVLDPDVAAVFPNAPTVNAALRDLAAMIRRYRLQRRTPRNT